jgi:hypothetical protein
MSRPAFWTGLVASCLACLPAGCGSGLATVSGEVTVDGAPLQKGTISFEALEGDAPPARDEIRDGHYEVRTAPGKKRVRISAPVVVRQQKESSAPDAPLIDITEESLPDHYHVNSDLTFDVEPGRNSKSWTVEPKVRKR